MKTKSNLFLIASAITLASLTFSSCESVEKNDLQELNILEVNTEGISNMLEENMTCLFDSTISISDAEKAMLVTMQEEEKLARDVYYVMYDTWDNIIFSKIAQAENNHLNAVITLLQNYEIEINVQDAGIFENEEFQSIYDELITAGSVSLEEALKIGAMIEEMDIFDLNTYLAQTENENIQMIFENLVKGSRNHLRAFNNQLQILGINYTPQYISQEEYDAIVNSDFERGNQYQRNNRQQGQRQRRGNR